MDYLQLFNVKVFGEIEFQAEGPKVLLHSMYNDHTHLDIFHCSCRWRAKSLCIRIRILRHSGWLCRVSFDWPKRSFVGQWACMRQACFAFTGTEVIGMTFGEVSDPSNNVPRAVKQTFWRIFTFYILGILVLGMALPYDSENLLSAISSSTSAGMLISVSILCKEHFINSSQMQVHSSLLLGMLVLRVYPISPTPLSWYSP